MPSLRNFSAWQVASSLFFVLLVMIEIGYRSGLKCLKKNEASANAMGTLKGAILALVGLLLGFSFSISSNRYETRRHLQIEEANAIGTAYLRGDMMDEPLRSQYKTLLKTYTEERITAFRKIARLDEAEWSNIAKATGLQNKIWQIVMSYVYEHPQGAASMLLPAALNQMIDIGLSREAARVVEIPAPIQWLLLISVMIAALMVGHSFGIVQLRQWGLIFLFSFLLSLVVYIIMDLDQPRRGLIQDQQKVMEFLKSTMN